jgi:hypothetical protein
MYTLGFLVIISYHLVSVYQDNISFAIMIIESVYLVVRYSQFLLVSEIVACGLWRDIYLLLSAKKVFRRLYRSINFFLAMWL